MNFNEEILARNIVFLRPNDKFTWASGIKSPIYCDNRLILQYPDLRNYVIEELIKLTKEYADVDVIMGTSTAGIPHATLVADRLDLPCGYVRGSKKKHGRSQQIEGADVKGKNVVVIEDLISTGKSCLEVVEILKEAGANVLGVVAIFSYNFIKAEKSFERFNIKYTTISNIDKLLTYCEENDKLTSGEIEEVKDFVRSSSDF